MNYSIVVLCAGNSTRIRSKKSKLLHSVMGKEVVFHVFDELMKIENTEFCAVINRSNENVKSHLSKRYGNDMRFVYQEQALGTAHALISVLESGVRLNERVLVVCGDTPLLDHRELLPLLFSDARVSFLSSQVKNPSGSGRIIRCSSGKVKEIIEEKEANPEQKQIHEINSGIYAFDLEFLKRTLSEVKNNNGAGEFYLTDLIKIAARERDVECLDIAEENVLGINNRCDLALVNKVMRDKIILQHMMSGVSFQNPESCWVDSSVDIGQECEIGCGVVLKGNTVIGSDTTIEPYCILNNSTIGSHVLIGSHSIIENSHIDQHVHLGPTTHLNGTSNKLDKVDLGNLPLGKPLPINSRKEKIGRNT